MKVKQWHNLMQSFGLEKNQETSEKLTKAYSEKQRHYHTFDHINACLKHLEKVRDLAEKPDEIEMALWFHDAIYKPLSSSNELDSAVWAAKFLTDNHVKQKIIDRVYQLIMVTLHDGFTQTNDQALMIDIDLTILGSPYETYQIFEKNIRKEYRLVPYFIYRKKRKEILQGFLKHDRIYRTNYFYELYETNARENMSHAISMLS